MAHPMIGLTKWLQREEWREPMVEVFVEHVGEACRDAGVDIEELEEVIGREAFIDAWGWACEDFVTRTLDDGRNFAANYLKRRGWKESPANRAFIEGLRHSVPSLYEVIAVEPGRHFTVRDLVRGGEPVQVDEPDRSRQMEEGERLALRLFRVRQRMRASEIILVFAPDYARDLQGSLDAFVAGAKTNAPEIAAELGRPDAAEQIAALTSLELVLPGAAPLFTDIWLRQILDDLSDPEDLGDQPAPRIVNSDGDAIEFAIAVYQLPPEVGDTDLDRVFADLPWVEPAPPSEKPPVQLEVENPYDGWTVVWHWIDHEALPDFASEEEEIGEDGVMRANPKSQSGRPVLGDLSRRDDTLRLAANTRTRLERGRALLEPALGDLVGPPEVSVQSMAEFVTEIFRLTRNDDG